MCGAQRTSWAAWPRALVLPYIHRFAWHPTVYTKRLLRIVHPLGPRRMRRRARPIGRLDPCTCHSLRDLEELLQKPKAIKCSQAVRRDRDTDPARPYVIRLLKDGHLEACTASCDRTGQSRWTRTDDPKIANKRRHRSESTGLASSDLWELAEELRIGRMGERRLQFVTDAPPTSRHMLRTMHRRLPTVPRSDDEHVIFGWPVPIRVRLLKDSCFAEDRRSYGELLAKFSAQGFRRCFTVFDVPTDGIPHVWIYPPMWRTLSQEDPPVLDEHGYDRTSHPGRLRHRGIDSPSRTVDAWTVIH